MSIGFYRNDNAILSKLVLRFDHLCFSTNCALLSGVRLEKNLNFVNGVSLSIVRQGDSRQHDSEFSGRSVDADKDRIREDDVSPSDLFQDKPRLSQSFLKMIKSIKFQQNLSTLARMTRLAGYVNSFK